VVALVLAAGSGYAQERRSSWDWRVGIGWHVTRAEAGDVAAQARLGQIYEHGLGVPRDPAEAARWYGLAAEQGHAIAQFKLASLLQSGALGSADYAAAARWYEAAARQGVAEAAYNLALMYDNGLGVEPDPLRAAALYEQAYAGGLAPAALARGLLALKVMPPRPDEALVWFEVATTAGVPGAEQLLNDLRARLTAGPGADSPAGESSDGN
jgi:TPR repeat protein